MAVLWRGFVSTQTGAVQKIVSWPSELARHRLPTDCNGIGELRFGETDSQLGVELFYMNEGTRGLETGGNFRSFEKSPRATAFEEFLASDFVPRRITSSPANQQTGGTKTANQQTRETIAVSGKVSAAELKLLREHATKARYFIVARDAAAKWVQAVDPGGARDEIALAHKWLDIHQGARDAEANCKDCAQDSDRYAVLSSFYKRQGGEFKAFADKWNRMSVGAAERETGEHIPTTAEVLVCAAADITGRYCGRHNGPR